jgi:hypothetical protein
VATGAGKNSIVMSLLRGVAPLVRDGLVRLWICDPKQMEFAKLREIAYRYADDNADCGALVGEYVQDMQATQRAFAGDGTRKITVSRETPLNLLILDELGALLAYGDPGTARDLRKQLSLVGSQGRATGAFHGRAGAGTHQGHRPGPGTVHHPDLPARDVGRACGHGARGELPAPRRAGRRDRERGGHRRDRLRDIGYVISAT